MLSNDGNWIIYEIVWCKETYRNGDWCGANLDKFFVKTPEYEYFTACGECWQKTGEHGTFDPIIALKVCKQLNEKYPDHDFHIRKCEISQTRTVVDDKMELAIYQDRLLANGY